MVVSSPIITMAQTPEATGSTAPSRTPKEQSATIVYTDAGFSPASITVAKGTTVTFVNHSSGDMWPASNPHPIHNGYPTTGGCKTSTFDACGHIASGSSWSFTFSIPGTWGYHNHLNPEQGGTVIVK